MTAKPPFIIDAGPALNFLASGNERLLTRAIGEQPLHAPASVETEVLRNAAKVKKFKGAEGRWKQMKPNWLTILADDSRDHALLAAAQTLLSAPLGIRLRQGDDLGETMVVLHAFARATAGQTVYVIIDDGGGRRFAQKAIDVLRRNKQSGRAVGAIHLVSTTDLIDRRINTKSDIPTQVDLRRIWTDISRMDDGLPNAVPARLSSSPRWQDPQRP